MSLFVERYADADSFLDRAGPFLLAREAEHNLILGLSSRLRDNPRRFGSDPYFATVSGTERDVVAAALRTPPHNLVLSEIDEHDVCHAFAADVAEVFDSLRGVLAPSGRAEEFVRMWEARTGERGRLVRRQRSHRATSVTPPEGVQGRMRPYADSDRVLVIRWLDAFVEEALGGATVEDSEAMLDHRLSDPDGGIVIWDDDGSVSLAGWGGPTPNGIRIGPVYTPRELRRRGYASAITAELTRSLLAGGRRFCFLFTDLANPTSNSIYRQVGYEPVADVEEWVFEPA